MSSKFDNSITKAAFSRNSKILEQIRPRSIADLPAKYLVQYAHLTCPATIWKFIEKASKVGANLVMLDMEDSIPVHNQELLETARKNIIRAFTELDWGKSLRFFRPRGLELDPGFEDIAVIVAGVGHHIDGLVYPKVESPQEVESIDRVLGVLEKAHGIEPGTLTVQVLIESVNAEKRVDEIALASPRLAGLIFGAFDYWGSMGLAPHLYHPDHPLIRDVRCRIIKAAASAGIPAIAEMTLNYPTKNKTEPERKQALLECRRDAELAYQYGFSGKWTGIPDQTKIVQDVFVLPEQIIRKALKEAKAYQEAQADGRGAIMIDGKMADRATDRINRMVLKQAYALGRIDVVTARGLGLV